MSHSSRRRRDEVDSWLLVVGSQTANLTSGPSFAHNLGCRCPNGQCEAIFDIYVSRPFQWHQEHPNARCFGPWCRALNIRESQRTQNLQLFQVLSFTPTLGQSGVVTLFPLGFIIDNWFEHAYYWVDWETNGHHLGYITFDLHGNHSPMAHHYMLKEAHTISYIQQTSHNWQTEVKKRQLMPKLLKASRWFLWTFNMDQRFYRGSKQPTNPWSKLCLVLKTWRAMIDWLNQYFVN